MAVSGYLSSDEEWAKFEPAWRQALDHFGVEMFHMTEFECRLPRSIHGRTKRAWTCSDIYDGVVSTPKTEAGRRQIPLSATALKLLDQWKRHAHRIEPDAFVFSTRHGHPLAPNNVLRRMIGPACHALALPRATWLTFRRTYASWSHNKGRRGKWWRN